MEKCPFDSEGTWLEKGPKHPYIIYKLSLTRIHSFGFSCNGWTNKDWIFCRIRYTLQIILKYKPGWLIWGDKAHLGVDVIWDSVSGSAVLHDLLPLKGTWKCQNVTACPPCEKHCSVGFGPFPQTAYTFEVSSQTFMALFCILHTLVSFLVILWT
jgi:hypothetical protein